MAVREIIVGTEAPILRAAAKPVTSFSHGVQLLIRDMGETLALLQGVGLAAPQVGESLQACLAKVAGGDFTFLNPVIVWRSGEITLLEEGCLSLPGLWVVVPRSQSITLRYRDVKWREQERRFSDMEARILQHEVDHLLGRLIVDYRRSNGEQGQRHQSAATL